MNTSPSREAERTRATRKAEVVAAAFGGNRAERRRREKAVAAQIRVNQRAR